MLNFPRFYLCEKYQSPDMGYPRIWQTPIRSASLRNVYQNIKTHEFHRQLLYCKSIYL